MGNLIEDAKRGSGCGVLSPLSGLADGEVYVGNKRLNISPTFLSTLKTRKVYENNEAWENSAF